MKFILGQCFYSMSTTQQNALIVFPWKFLLILEYGTLLANACEVTKATCVHPVVSAVDGKVWLIQLCAGLRICHNNEYILLTFSELKQGTIVGFNWFRLQCFGPLSNVACASLEVIWFLCSSFLSFPPGGAVGEV